MDVGENFMEGEGVTFFTLEKKFFEHSDYEKKVITLQNFMEGERSFYILNKD